MLGLHRTGPQLPQVKGPVQQPASHADSRWVHGVLLLPERTSRAALLRALAGVVSTWNEVREQLVVFVGNDKITLSGEGDVAESWPLPQELGSLPVVKSLPDVVGAGVNQPG